MKAAAEVQKVGAVKIHVEMSPSLLLNCSVRGSRPGVSIVVVLRKKDVSMHHSRSEGV
jgi:hypothetical protein